MRTTRALLAMAIVVLLIAPAATARSGPNVSTPTTLQFHIFDTFNKFPINTQPMNEEFFEVGGTNFPTIASQGYDLNTIYGYSTSGPVEYEVTENGRPRFHPERGIADDVILDMNYETFAYMYLDVRDITGLDTAPNYLPSFTFRITMREGDDVGRDADLDAGALIMQGEMTAHVFDGGTTPAGAPLNDGVSGQADPEGTPVLTPDEDGIVEFKIPMDLSVGSGVIPADQAYNIRIDWFQNPSDQEDQDDQYAEGYMRLVADGNHRPRLEMAVMNPIYIDFIHPQVAAGILLIHTGVNSPWGTYDVAVEGVELNVEGPTSPLNLQRIVAQNAHVHNKHHLNAEITYLWRFRDEGAKDGEYTISMSVPNLNQNAVATDSAKFIVEGKKAFGQDTEGNTVEPTEADEGEESPGVGAALVAGLLALIGVALRRRP